MTNQQNDRRFEGTADLGAKPSPAGGQITETELQRMTPEQIVAAQKEGRLNDLLGR